MPDKTRTQVLTEEDADRKAEMTLKIRDLWEQGEIWPPAAGGDGWHRGHPLLPRQPARPGHVTLVEPSRVKQGNRAAFVHTLVHAESYAIDLMWDLMARFGGEALPRAFYDDWVRVASEEAVHYARWRDRLAQLGSFYGAYPAHNSLWDSASETSHDLLARLAIVHMVHEARGLDVAAAGLARLMKGNPPDLESAQILERNVIDETGHVGFAVKWFSHVCHQRGLGDPKEVFHDYVRRLFRGALRPPFNDEARRAAGMTPEWYLPLSSPADSRAGGGAEGGGREAQEGAGGLGAGRGSEQAITRAGSERDQSPKLASTLPAVAAVTAGDGGEGGAAEAETARWALLAREGWRRARPLPRTP